MTITMYKHVPVLGDQYAFERTVIHVPQVIESPTSQTLPATIPAAESATSESVQVSSKQSSDKCARCRPCYQAAKETRQLVQA